MQILLRRRWPNPASMLYTTLDVRDNSYKLKAWRRTGRDSIAAAAGAQ
jgi:hypothetical protein